MKKLDSKQHKETPEEEYMRTGCGLSNCSEDLGGIL